MSLEIATYIDGLNTANPTALDLKSQGDDHIRLLKSTLKATFPALTAPVTATAAQLNNAALTSWVRQGGGAGQLTNMVYVGWAGSTLNLQVDEVNFANVWPMSVTGSAGSARAATAGYFTAVNAAGPVIELHKIGSIAGAWYINSANKLAFGQTIGDGAPTAERMILDITNGNMVIQGTLTQASDERLKINWRPLADDFTARLARVKSGVYKRTDTQVTQVGVSAQSLREVLPEAVAEDDSGEHLSVAYGNAALAACIELAKELVALRAEVAELKAAL